MGGYMMPRARRRCPRPWPRHRPSDRTRAEASEPPSQPSRRRAEVLSPGAGSPVDVGHPEIHPPCQTPYLSSSAFGIAQCQLSANVFGVSVSESTVSVEHSVFGLEYAAGCGVAFRPFFACILCNSSNFNALRIFRGGSVRSGRNPAMATARSVP